MPCRVRGGDPPPRAACLVSAALPISASAATVTLYDQDFEVPVGYVNDGGDVNIFKDVNTFYGGQPAGFAFAQDFTVETLNVSGSAPGAGDAAFRTGHSNPDVSSIALSTFGGSFVNLADVPIFHISLFDTLFGTIGVAGNGVLLDGFDLTGTASARTTFDWTRGLFGLSTAGNTNGNATLQVDLLQGGYAAFDNLVLTASDTPPPPPVAPIPLPAGLPLLLAALMTLLPWRARRGRADGA